MSLAATSALRRTLPIARSTAARSAFSVSNNLSQHSRSRPFSSTTAAMGVHNLTSKAEFDDAVKQDGLMVLDCYATWCGPCKVISPKVVQFSDQYANARFYKLDVDEVPEVAQELSVRSIPAFMFFKGGEKVSEVVGANPSALEAAIKTNI